jgi:MFS family permease
VPRASRWYIRASLIHLLAGFTVGALLMMNRVLPSSPALWRLLPLHIELLLVGWVVQLTMGVAFWILPRFAGARGRAAPVWLALPLLNLGVALAALAPALALPPWTRAIGRVLQVAAVVAFAANAWRRVKPTESPISPARTPRSV